MRVYTNDYIYIENFFSGRRRLFYKNEELFKNENGNYEYKENDETKEIIIKGSLLTGVSAINGEIEEVLVKGIRWYEYLLSFLYLGFVLYGSDYLVSAFIAAMFGILNLVVVRGIKNVFIKIIASIINACICFGVMVVVYMIIKVIKGE